MNLARPKRTYSMEARAVAAQATRDRIVVAAREAFLDGWFDDVTLADIARRAGVSGQTVLNHFGSKEQVFAAAHASIGADVQLRRYAVTPGDVPAIVDALVDDYEVTGDATIRLLALEEKVAAARPLLEEGRAGHRRWVEEIFDAPELVEELVVATDVYTWKLLRRDRGLSRAKTATAIRRIVEALLRGQTP